MIPEQLDSEVLLKVEKIRAASIVLGALIDASKTRISPELDLSIRFLMDWLKDELNAQWVK